MNVYAKFRCAPLRMKKALGIFRELITTRTTRTIIRVAFGDPPSGSKNKKNGTFYGPHFSRTRTSMRVYFIVSLAQSCYVYDEWQQ